MKRTGCSPILLKRWTHDEALKNDRLVPLTEEEIEVARKRIEPPDAWLSYQRLENGSIYIRVGWAQDFTSIHEAVKSAIPETGRTYNARLNEWRVDPRYESRAGGDFHELRTGGRAAAAAAGGSNLPGSGIHADHAAYPSGVEGLAVPYHWHSRHCDHRRGSCFRPTEGRPVSARATATALAFISSYEPLESDFDTVTTGTHSGLAGTLLHPSVNLRERPEAAGPVLKLLGDDQTYRVIGRLEDSSWYVATTGDLTGWIAAWTIAVEGEPEGLPVFGESEILPGTVDEGTSEAVTE